MLRTRLFYQLGTAHKMECVLRAVRKHICAGLSMEQLVHGQPEEGHRNIIVQRHANKRFCCCELFCFSDYDPNGLNDIDQVRSNPSQSSEGLS